MVETTMPKPQGSFRRAHLESDPRDVAGEKHEAWLGSLPFSGYWWLMDINYYFHLIFWVGLKKNSYELVAK